MTEPRNEFAEPAATSSVPTGTDEESSSADQAAAEDGRPDTIEAGDLLDAEDAASVSTADALQHLTVAVDGLTEQSQRFHARAEQREGVIERMHDELQLLRRGERRSMLRPLLTEVCRLRDDLLRQTRKLPEDFDAARTRELLLSYAESLEQALADSGVVSYRPGPDEPFEVRTHRPVGRQPTDVPEQVGLIAAARRDGYRDLETGLPISPAEVTVYVAGPVDGPGDTAPAASVPEKASATDQITREFAR